MSGQFREVQAEVLKAFQEEIPSVYYSDKTLVEFESWKTTMNHMYHDLMNFPPRLFSGQRLLDFGAGTGENTVYFSNWGAKCTLVEMNDKAHSISKEIFQKYSSNNEDHEFVLSSIFDFEHPAQFDIVHSRGVFAHTNDPETAFKKLASFLRPGGYLIYGDGNKAGNFQNMLQRLLVFTFADNWEDMVKVAEKLFNEDLDRAQKFANRTRRCIIFDKWVVPRLTNPSVSEVLTWMSESNIKLYSSYPPVVPAILSDSLHHKPFYAPEDFTDIAALTEAFWMIYNTEDRDQLPKILETFPNLSRTQYELTDYLDDFNSGNEFDPQTMNNCIENYLEALGAVDITSNLKSRMKVFFDEVSSVLTFADKNDLEGLSNYVGTCRELFRGGNGVRHIDFIGYKPEAE